MTEYNKYDVNDVLSNVINQQPIDFINSFNSLLGDKISELVTNKKIELAQSMFNNSSDLDDNTEEE